jgi:hypothetical protein
MTLHVAPFPLLVTDHAVVRWLERVVGADIERIRDEIRAACARRGCDHLTDLADQAAVYIDAPEHGVHLVVREGEVITVFHAGNEAD